MELAEHLWLPILASAAAVWIASALVWMVLPHHRKDHRQLPDENALVETLRRTGVAPGVYGFPHCSSRAESSSAEFQKRWKDGPAGFLTVMTPSCSMGKNMLVTFLVYVVISIMIAYLGWTVLPRGTEFLRAFQVMGTAGVIAYSFAFIPGGVWFQNGRANMMCVLDGIGYGLITGAIFAAMWPASL